MFLNNRYLLFLYVMLIVSVGYFITALSLGEPVSNGGLTPSFFPICVGAAAIFFASTLIVQNWREDPPVEKKDDAPSTYTHLWVMVAILAYITLFSAVGYFISSWLFVFALIVLFSSFEKLLQKGLISAVIVGLGFLLFQQLFGVRLPTVWG